MEQRKVSVIIPIYKVEKYLDRCMKSVFLQSYKNIEIILVDDGSPDECPRMCEQYAKEDDRIKVIHKENGGLSSARNAGLDISTGDYVMFLDSDDYVSNEYVKSAVDGLEKADAQWLAFNYRIENESDGSCVETDFASNFFEIKSDDDRFKLLVYYMQWKASYSVWNKIYVRNIIEENGLRFEDNKKIFAEDIYFNMCYLIHVNRIACIKDCLMTYIERSNSIMGKEGNVIQLNRFVELNKAIFSYYEKNNFKVKDLCIIQYLLYNGQYNKSSLSSVKTSLKEVEDLAVLKCMHKKIILRWHKLIKIIGFKAVIRMFAMSTAIFSEYGSRRRSS